MKIAVLCNHPLAIPSIDYLLTNNLLAGIACPAIPTDNLFRLQMLCDEKKIPFAVIEEQDINKGLSEWLKKAKADVVFCLTFPYKIPKESLKLVKHGFLNFHTGLLPTYRGGDPIFWQIFAQEQKGGISVHLMDEKIDRGPIAHIEYCDITPEDTYGQHSQKLALTARNACIQVVENFDKLKFTPQDQSKGAFQPRPNFLNLIIDWDRYPAATIKALIRASNPTYGGAITFFRGVPVHILQVSIGSVKSSPETKPGTIVSASKDNIIVLSSDQKLIRLDVLYTEDGFFTGGKLASTFDIKEGEQFTLPPMPPAPPEGQEQK